MCDNFSSIVNTVELLLDTLTILALGKWKHCMEQGLPGSRRGCKISFKWPCPSHVSVYSLKVSPFQNSRSDLYSTLKMWKRSSRIGQFQLQQFEIAPKSP